MNPNALVLLTGVSSVGAFLPPPRAVTNDITPNELEGLRLGLGATAITLLLVGSLIAADSRSTVPFGIAATMAFVVWAMYEMRANGYATA